MHVTHCQLCGERFTNDDPRELARRVVIHQASECTPAPVAEVMRRVYAEKRS